MIRLFCFREAHEVNPSAAVLMYFEGEEMPSTPMQHLCTSVQMRAYIVGSRTLRSKNNLPSPDYVFDDNMKEANKLFQISSLK